MWVWMSGDLTFNFRYSRLSSAWKPWHGTVRHMIYRDLSFTHHHWLLKSYLLRSRLDCIATMMVQAIAILVDAIEMEVQYIMFGVRCM